MTKVLVFGGSDLFKNKIYPALLKCNNCSSIEVASKSNKNNLTVNQSKISCVYADYDVAFKNSDASWIYISTKNDEHYELARKALYLGKNVIIDKPAVLNVKQALDLVRISEENDLFLCEAVVFTYHKQFINIAQFHNTFGINNIFWLR